jgi:DNA-binding response OmpR family regulator
LLNKFPLMQPPSREAAAAIVFEKRPRWGPELERQFQNENVRVVECRSISDVAQRSALVSRGVVLLDLGFRTSECLRFLASRAGDGAALPVFIIGSNQTAALEWPVRDLGAAAFFAKTIPGHEMAELCRRHWAGSPLV